MVCPQVYKMEAELRYKLFPPNAWMKVFALQCFYLLPQGWVSSMVYRTLRLAHIIPAIVHRYTKVFAAVKSYTSPFLSLPSMLAELRTSLGGCHSLEVSSCFLDGKTTSTIPLKYAPRQKQAFKFGCADGSGQGSRRGSHVTRSAPGCGILAGPSLESAGFQSQKPKGYSDSPGLKRPGALQKPRRPGRVLFTVDQIWQTYTW
jgi:hypothetical protein